MINRVRKIYIAALALIAILLLVAQVFIQIIIANQQHDAHIVNSAGKQRWYSQEIVKVLLKEKLKISKNERIDLYDSYIDFKKSHIKNENYINGLADSDAEMKVKNKFEKHDVLFHEIINSLDSVILYAEKNPIIYDLHIQKILSIEKEFLTASNHLATALEELNAEKVSFLMQIEIYVFIATILTIFAEIVYIFNPLFKEVKKQYNDLHNQNVEIESMVEELQTAEEELVKKSISLDEAHKIARMGEWVYDIERRELKVSDTFYEILEIPRQDALNPQFLLEIVHEEDKKKLAVAYQKSLLKQTPFRFEFRINTPNGRLKHLLSFCHTEYNAAGKGKFSVGIIQDISVEKIFIEELQKSNNEKMEALQKLEIERSKAEEAGLAKSSFLANMSHEVRTPLNAILGFSELLKKTQLDDKQKEYLHAVSSSSEALLAILNDILDFAKAEANKIVLDLQTTNLEKLITQISEIYRLQAEEKNLQFIKNISPEIPQFVAIDAIRFRQILINLISNAVKFTPKGEVEISAQLLEKEEDKAIIRFAVRDTGIGIDEENLQKLLTPFTQADGSTTRLYGGTGLGLSISEKLLNLMDSHLQLAGESGKGSTFFFDLNLKIQKQENQSQSKKEQADSNEFIIFPHKVKIMVAEDNLVNQKLLRKFINSCAPQADLMICNNGEEVLQEFMNFQPDYVFMDVHMPVMNGYLATEYIRNNFKNTHIPVIAISAGVSDDEVDLAKKSGMNAFVPKPFNLKSISEILHDFLPVE